MRHWKKPITLSFHLKTFNFLLISFIRPIQSHHTLCTLSSVSWRYLISISRRCWTTLARLGSAAHIPNFSSFFLPSRLIVSVGTFIAPIENCESRPRKAFVCLRLNKTDKERVSVLIRYQFQTSFHFTYPFFVSASYWLVCFVSVNEFRSVERLICFPVTVLLEPLKGFAFVEPSSIFYLEIFGSLPFVLVRFYRGVFFSVNAFQELFVSCV